MSTFNVQKSFAIVLCLIAFSSEAVQANLINFGGHAQDPNAAAYYLMADSDSVRPQPNDELKRTQRSFWKKLFKHGLFGEDDCDDCNYDVGDGNNYNMNRYDQPFPGFQPFRSIQQWRPFQPLFSESPQRCKYQDCNNNNYAYNQGTPSYNSNADAPPTYQQGNTVAGNSYDKQVQNSAPSYSSPTAEPLDSKYESISDAPTNYDNKGKKNYAKGDNSYSKTENSYSKPSNSYSKPSNSYSKPSNSYSKPSNSYSKTENNYLKGITSLQPSYENSKMPQILYQPIIYVSPELKDCILVKSGESCAKQKTTNIGDYKTLGAQVTYPPKQTQKYEEAYVANNKLTPPPYSSTTCGTSSPSFAPYQQPCSLHSPPTVSTVSTIYTIITPSKNPTDSKQNDGPSKYSLFQPGAVSTPIYGNNELSTNLNLPAYNVAPQSQPCVPPMVMTTDDQPYRMCPELFDEYNHRYLNKITPSHHHGHQQQKAGNTFVNTQLINM